MFKVGHRLRNGGLRHLEADSSFRHSARVDDSHENIELAQLEVRTDAVGPRHCTHPSRISYDVISIFYYTIIASSATVRSRFAAVNDDVGARDMTGRKIVRRGFLHLLAGATALPSISHLARAQSYPTRPVRIVVGF